MPQIDLTEDEVTYLILLMEQGYTIEDYEDVEEDLYKKIVKADR